MELLCCVTCLRNLPHCFTMAFLFCMFILNHTGKWKAVCIWMVCFGTVWSAHVLMISFYFSSFLLFPFFPFFPRFVLLSPYFPLNFFAYCSSPCLFSCSNSPGSKDHYWACACSPTSCPAYSYASWPYHNAFDQTNTNRCHAKRNSSSHRCNSATRTRSWFNLHPVRVPLHAGTSYINPWVSHWT